VRVLITGGTGVLGRAAIPLLLQGGHQVFAPGHAQCDLFDPAAVARAVADCDAVMHLATRIPPRERRTAPEAWAENDRLRKVAAQLLVDAAIGSSTQVFVQPTVAFIYPSKGLVDESTGLEHIPPHLQSALTAEAHALRFAAAGRRGIVLRLGLLYGAGTGADAPNPLYDARLHIEDAGSALVAALSAASGIYNLVRDAERVSNARFKQATGWSPRF
jgi:nucleoside-diphosphate-sugar epimerase